MYKECAVELRPIDRVIDDVEGVDSRKNNYKGLPLLMAPESTTHHISEGEKEEKFCMSLSDQHPRRTFG